MLSLVAGSSSSISCSLYSFIISISKAFSFTVVWAVGGRRLVRLRWDFLPLPGPPPSGQLREGPRHQREGGPRVVLGRSLWVLALRGGLLGLRHITLPNIFYAHEVVPVPVLAPGHHVVGAPLVLTHVQDLDHEGGDLVLVIEGYLGIFHFQDSPLVQWCLLPLFRMSVVASYRTLKLGLIWSSDFWNTWDTLPASLIPGWYVVHQVTTIYNLANSHVPPYSNEYYKCS